MNRKLKNEAAYLWMTFKWPLLCAFVIVFVAAAFLAAALNKKDTVLSVMLIDCHSEVSQDEMEKDFMTALGIDMGKQQAEFLTDLLFSDAGSGSYAMTSLSRFLTEIGNGKLDVCAMLEEDFIKYDNSDTWADLSELLGEALLSVPGDSLLVKDGRVIGIDTKALPVLAEYGCYEYDEKRGIIGVVYNSPHRETAADYLMYAAGLSRQK